MSKVIKPKSNLIEKVAIEFAGVFYEVGRSQGLTSKYKNARLYAKHNFERFVPKAVDHLLDILNNPNFSKEAKDEIWLALSERHNDPNLQTGNELPNIDVKKLISLVDAGKVDHSSENLKVIELMNKPKPKPFIIGQDNG